MSCKVIGLFLCLMGEKVAEGLRQIGEGRKRREFLSLGQGGLGCSTTGQEQHSLFHAGCLPRLNVC